MVKKSLIHGGSSSNGTTNGLMFVISILLSVVVYLLWGLYNDKDNASPKQKVNIINNINKEDGLNIPPLKYDNYYYRNNSGNLPINIRTHGFVTEYSQVGILTKDETDKHPLILPLMGRRIDRNKMQYYAISNTGSMNTKLPVKKNGRSCTDERGCDELFSSDMIFVEGYKASFKVSIYENTHDFTYTI